MKIVGYWIVSLIFFTIKAIILGKRSKNTFYYNSKNTYYNSKNTFYYNSKNTYYNSKNTCYYNSKNKKKLNEFNEFSKITFF